MGGLACFSALGLPAALARPTASPSWAVPTLVGAAAAALALALLVRTAPLAPAAADPAAELAPHDDPAAGPDAADPVPAAARWWPDAPAAGPPPPPRGRPAGAPRPPPPNLLVPRPPLARAAARGVPGP